MYSYLLECAGAHHLQSMTIKMISLKANRNFYVDDLLMLLDSPRQAGEMTQHLRFNYFKEAAPRGKESQTELLSMGKVPSTPVGLHAKVTFSVFHTGV